MTRLEMLVVSWRYWDVQTQAAEGTENWAEYHDQFLAADRELKDVADRLAEVTTRTVLPRGVSLNQNHGNAPVAAPSAIVARLEPRLSVQPHETVDGTGGGG